MKCRCGSDDKITYSSTQKCLVRVVDQKSHMCLNTEVVPSKPTEMKISTKPHYQQLHEVGVMH